MSEDQTSATPFALLLNAISGTGEGPSNGNVGGSSQQIRLEEHGDDRLDEDHGLNSSGFGFESLLNGNRDLGLEHENDVEIQRAPMVSAETIREVISSMIVADAQKHLDPDEELTGESSSAASRMSKLEVWHPTTGQKSYGKECRLLNPPPFLKVSGSLSSLVTTASLSAVKYDSQMLASQTHHIPIDNTASEPVPDSTDFQAGLANSATQSRREERKIAKRKLREAAVKSGFAAALPSERTKQVAREREVLSDGLPFPGLWVGEAIAKDKEFRLDLTIGELGVDSLEPRPAQIEAIPDDGTDGTTHNQAERDQATTNIVNSLEAATAMNDTQIDSSNIDPIFLDQPKVPAARKQPQPSRPPGPGWATFSSSPISIVSKPSKKTAKARSVASCLSTGSSVALWVRINSQAVRTKYMKLDSKSATPQFTARSGSWTPFHFEIIRRASPPREDGKATKGRFRLPEFDPNVITYGSILCLVDSQSGIKSEPVKLVKVEKSRVLLDEEEGHPVSELQRVGFVKQHEGEDDVQQGSRLYLSAPSARTGGGELLPPKPIRVSSKASKAQATQVTHEVAPITLDDASTAKPDAEVPPESRPTKRQKTQRNALAAAIVAEEEEGSLRPILSWAKAERSEFEVPQDKSTPARSSIGEVVEDWMCWVIGGVSNFTYSFFDLNSPMGISPDRSIEPAPRALTKPEFRAETNTLEIVLSEFFHSDRFGQPIPFDLYLGPIGPLRVTSWRSTAPNDCPPQQPYQAVPYHSNQEMTTVWSSFPGATPHVLVVASMPSADEILQVMRQITTRVQRTLEVERKKLSDIADQIKRDQQPATIAQAVPSSTSMDDTSTWIHAFDSPSAQVTSDIAIEAVMQQFSRPEDLGDVTDLEAALRAVDRHAFNLSAEGTFEEHMNGGNIDPLLESESGREAHQAPEQVIVPTSEPHGSFETLDQPQPPSTVALAVPQQAENQDGPVNLPLFLIRKRDALGYGLGFSVAAEKLKSDDAAGESQWGLQLVPS